MRPSHRPQSNDLYYIKTDWFLHEGPTYKWLNQETISDIKGPSEVFIAFLWGGGREVKINQVPNFLK